VNSTPPKIQSPPAGHSGYRRAIRVTWIGIAVTVVQAAVKIAAGVLTRSTALLADGLENVADTGVSLAAIVGLSIARTPADAEHPYGHGKAEALTAVAIAWVMVLLAMGMAARAVMQVVHPEQLHPPDWPALLFLAGTCLVGEWLYRYKLGEARRLKSAALYAEAFDHRKDVFSSVVALVADAAAIGLGGRFALLDPVAALITCGFIGWMSLRIMRESTPHLMDEAITGLLLDEIRQIAREVPGVRGTEKLVARRSGLDVLVELHVEVDPAMTVADAHETATEVRRCIRQRIDSVADVLVHIEPHRGGK
jgi:cation diffusion facilitator family transporter